MNGLKLKNSVYTGILEIRLRECYEMASMALVGAWLGRMQFRK